MITHILNTVDLEYEINIMLCGETCDPLWETELLWFSPYVCKTFSSHLNMVTCEKCKDEYAMGLLAEL